MHVVQPSDASRVRWDDDDPRIVQKLYERPSKGGPLAPRSGRKKGLTSFLWLPKHPAHFVKRRDAGEGLQLLNLRFCYDTHGLAWACSGWDMQPRRLIHIDNCLGRPLRSPPWSPVGTYRNRWNIP